MQTFSAMKWYHNTLGTFPENPMAAFRANQLELVLEQKPLGFLCVHDG
jgi:hypothetical protein